MLPQRILSVRAALMVSVVLLGGAGAAGDEQNAAETQMRGRVRSHFDIPYAGPESDPKYQVLDVHIPERFEGLPVIFFIHGGAFHMSDKRDERYYPETGERLARAGFVAVLPNYRLTPAVRYPAHAEDIAAALAWTLDHIAEYGGDPARIFLSGHSAGGFLAAAVTLDRRFLDRHDKATAAIRGVIPICGQFEVVDSGRQDTFGGDDGRWSSFSPLTHVRDDAPPFLILEAVRDDWWAPGQAEVFRRSLLELKVIVEFHELDHDHFTIITQIGMEQDPVLGLIRAFVERSLSTPAR
jgi:acetyl esterase/lipase